MAVLVDGLAAEPEIPVDDLDRAVDDQLVQAGLLADFAAGRLGRRLAGFEVPFREAPVPVGILDQEVADRAVCAAAEHDSAGAGLALSPPPALRHAGPQKTLKVKYFRGFAWMSDRSCCSWIMVSVVSR